MISSATLHAWTAEPSAVRATLDTMERFAETTAHFPAIAALQDGLPEAEAAGAQAVLALARRFICDDDSIDRILRAAIDAARGDPFFRPTFRASTGAVHNGLLLFGRPSLSIQLAVLSAEALAAKRAYRDGPSSVVFTGQRSLYRFVDAGDAVISLWQAPPARPTFSVADAPRCSRVERRPLRDGEMLDIDGATMSFVIDQAPRDIVYLQAHTPLDAAPLSVEYDSQSLTLVGTASTDDAGSRTQMMLGLLRLQERRDAASLFLRAARGPHFNARWQAMREFLALDADAALPELEHMARHDDHPEVRAAARAALDSLFHAGDGGEPCPA